MPRSEKILIVEDELLIAEHIADLLGELGFHQLRMVDSVEEAIVEIEKDRPDLVFTDISLSTEMTGIDLGEKLNGEYQIPFIYITSHSGIEMVRMAGQTAPNAFLVKPFKEADLTVAVELAVQAIRSKSETNFLMIKEGYDKIRIPFHDIVSLNAEKNYTIIQIKNKRPKLVRFGLTKIMEMLPLDKFVRVHKSFVVNREMITGVNANMVYLDTLEFPLGRVYRQEVVSSLR